MANGQRRFGELLQEVMDEMSEPVTFEPEAIDACVAEIHRLLAKARAEIDAEVTEEHMLAFLGQGTPFTAGQQRLLFADPPTRERFLALRRQRTIPLPSQRPGAGAGFVELTARIAAAGLEDWEFERPFAGGTLKVSRVGVDEQVYLRFRFDDPKIPTRLLIIERVRDQRLERIELEPPNNGEIVLIKDLALPDEKALVDLLRDPTTTGDFER
jgi:hypothetical protein